MSARIEHQADRIIVWNGNGAKRGALSPELYDAILNAIELAQSPNVRSIILTSEEDFFCAGGDLNVLISRRNLTLAERRGKIDQLHDLVRAMRQSPVPIIAAVKGGAAGAGMSLALGCDFVVASQGAKFTAAYVKAGLVPDGGLTASLARLVPQTLAMELCLLGRSVTAERFSELGAINTVCPLKEVLPEAHSLADALARGPREAQRVIRNLVANAYETTQNQALNAECDAMAEASGGPEAGIGIAAFLGKHAPDFGSAP